MSKNTTVLIEDLYPNYIIKKLRNRLGEDENDSSVDDEILSLSKNEVFSHVLKWDGLLGSWDYEIKRYVNDIYGINLDDFK